MTAKEKVLRLCAAGKLVINVRGLELLQAEPGESEDDCWMRIKGKLGSGKELEQTTLLVLKRSYWVVESRLYHCLDITLREDESRVRTPNAARVLGTIRRVVVSLANAAVDGARAKNLKTKHNTRTFQQRFRSARGGRERLRALILAKRPDVLHL